MESGEFICLYNGSGSRRFFPIFVEASVARSLHFAFNQPEPKKPSLFLRQRMVLRSCPVSVLARYPFVMFATKGKYFWPANMPLVEYMMPFGRQ